MTGDLRSALGGRVGGALVIGGVLGAIGLGVLVDRFVDPTDVDIVSPPPAPTPIQGAWYCAVGETVDGDRLDVVGISPERTSDVHIETFAQGEIDPAHRMRLDAGTLQLRELEDGVEDLGVLAVWENAPAVVSRTWRLDDDRDVPGTIHGPCVTETSSQWYLTGAATDGGSVARLVLANPFETDAAINVSLLTPDGPETPELLQNVGVPARTTRTIELNEFAPERADLGAIVTLRSGRVIAEGWQSVDPAIGDISGVALTRLATEAALRWSIPWVPLAEAESWVTVANVGEGSAAIRIVVHTEDGATTAEDVDEITVPEGAVQRIDLGAVFPEEVEAGGVTVISENEVPIVVASVGRTPHDDVERTGILHLLGHPEPHTRWVLPVVPGLDRSATLHLVNPTDDRARVDVSLLTADGEVRPDALTDIEVGLGGRIEIELDEHLPEQTEVYALLVTARDSAVGAALHSVMREGPRHAVLNGGIAGVTGRTPLERRHVSPDPGMTRRLGTILGPRVELLEDVPPFEDDEEPDVEDDDPEPDPEGDAPAP